MNSKSIKAYHRTEHDEHSVGRRPPSKPRLTDLNDPQPDRVRRVELRWILPAEEAALKRREDERGELGYRNSPLTEWCSLPALMPPVYAAAR